MSLFFLSTSIGPAAETPKPVSLFPVTDFGAKGDGQTLNTKSVQTAIDRCAAAGGGQVVLPHQEIAQGRQDRRVEQEKGHQGEAEKRKTASEADFMTQHSEQTHPRLD